MFKNSKTAQNAANPNTALGYLLRMMKTELSNAALTSAISAGNKTIAGGTVGSLSGLLLSINWLSMAGFLATMAGVGISFYFSYLKNKREEKEAAEESILKARREERDQAEHLARIRILESQYRSFTPENCKAAHIQAEDLKGQ